MFGAARGALIFIFVIAIIYDHKSPDTVHWLFDWDEAATEGLLFETFEPIQFLYRNIARAQNRAIRAFLV